MNLYDSYQYTYNTTADSITAGILAIYFIVLAVMFLFYVVSYVFKGIGMYTIAKRQGMDYPWLAFIPFARTYLHGELGGPVKLKNKTIKNPGIWLLALPFIFGAVVFVFYMLLVIVGMGAFSSTITSSVYGHNDFGYSSPGVSSGMLMGLIVIAIFWSLFAVLYKAVISVLKVLVDHQIFGKFTSKNMSIAHGVLSTLLPLYESICLFVMRNRDFNPGMEPDLGRPFVQMPIPPIMPGGGAPGAGMPGTGVPGPGPYEAADMHMPYGNVPPVRPEVPVPEVQEPVPPVRPGTPAPEVQESVPPIRSEAPVPEAQEPVRPVGSEATAPEMQAPAPEDIEEK